MWSSRLAMLSCDRHTVCGSVFLFHGEMCHLLRWAGWGVDQVWCVCPEDASGSLSLSPSFWKRWVIGPSKPASGGRKESRMSPVTQYKGSSASQPIKPVVIFFLNHVTELTYLANDNGRLGQTSTVPWFRSPLSHFACKGKGGEKPTFQPHQAPTMGWALH